MSGRVLRIIAYPGELVGLEGLLEMGNVSRMYAIAEVWETDIGRARVGQKATVTSLALPAPLSGTVEHVRLEVRKQDATGTDPAARKDARIVEVEVLLDKPEMVASLTNLQVEVLLHP
jgi:HlyD family secretion protein